MFQQEQQFIEEKIKAFSALSDLSLAELKWQPIPFAGEWGVSTSFFQTAANEARAGRGSKLPVPQRAQEIAERRNGARAILAIHLRPSDSFPRRQPLKKIRQMKLT